jgi:hypothetical protein
MPDENKKITLDDLSNGAKHTAAIPPPLPRFDAKTVRDVNIAEVAQKAPEPEQVDMVPGVIKNAINQIPATIQRLNNESLAIVQKGKEERIEQMLDSDEDLNEVEMPTNSSKPVQSQSNIIRQSFDDDDGIDFDDDIKDDDDEVDFPISKKTKVERKVNTMENNNNTPQAELNEKIHAIAEAVAETPEKVEFPEPTDTDKEKLAEKAKEAYEAVTGEVVIDSDKLTEAIANDPPFPKDNSEPTTEASEEEAIPVLPRIPSSSETDFGTATFVMSDDDLALLDDEDMIVEKADKAKEVSEAEEKEKRNELRNAIRTSVKENFKPIENKLNLAEFEIQKKPISASKVLNHIKETPVRTATTPLFSTTKKVVEVSEFTATEIQKLNPSLINQNNFYTVLRDRYQLLYNHIVDPNKPATFEAWLKTVPEDAIDDYFFAAYKATFGAANILTYECPKEECGNVFLKEVPVMSMIKYKNETIKSEYLDLLHNGELNVSKDTYTAGLFQASDEYVFALKTPTLYERVFEPTLLDSKILETYGDLITLITYIDGIYVIDEANKKLIPVDMQPIHTDPRKTVRRRIKTCASIIRTLTSDQLQTLTVETDKYDKPDSKRNINDDDDEDTTPEIQYIYPECECPKCKSKINEAVANPVDMLFTRHQLGIYQRI